jgi:hypothetical protein
MKAGLFFVAVGSIFPAGAEIFVEPGGSIQEAIDLAVSGERITLAEGRYEGNLDFSGKAVTVRGVGPESVIVGDGSGSVVRFASGEGNRSVLDSVQVTGGFADAGGGILIVNSSPTVRRTVIFDNQANETGAGIYVRGDRARPLIENNLIAYNFDPRPEALSDAHQVFVDNGASAVVVNNTIVRGNGNGLLLERGRRPTVVRNNLFIQNGSRLPSGAPTGRGICDFGGSARIQDKLFDRNLRAAVLTGDLVDFRLVSVAEVAVGEGRFRSNQDGDSRLRRRAGRRVPGELDATAFVPRRTSPAVDAGAEGRRFLDRDGSRNDLGHTGGPSGWR